jgi:NADH-quinone oxidoreductase subunit N
MDVNLLPLLPVVQVLLTALVVVLRDLFIDEHKPKGFLALISLIGIGLAAAESVALWGSQEGGFNDAVMLDNFALFFSLIFLIVAALTILSSIHYIRQAAIREGEYYALILFATVGMMLMASANDLLVFFLGLETMSIAVYVLTGMWRSSSRSSEAAMKYFLMGAFATGFLLYGIALIYGATGSTNLNVIADYLIEKPTGWPLYLVGGGFLLLIGFAFKVGADAGQRFHVGGGKSGGVCGVGARLDAPAVAPRRRLGVPVMGHRHRYDDAGQFAGHRPEQRQTHARLFEYRSCRLSADRRGRR